MASIVRIKRSAVQGKAPTTSEILAGELALNTRDGKLFSSDGNVVFEVGANVHSLSVGSGGLLIANGALSFPLVDGGAGQVLTTNGSGQLSFSSVEQVQNPLFTQNANTKISSSATEIIVDEFAVETFRSAKYMVQVDNADHLNQFQTSEVLLIHNGSATFMTEYGQVATSSTIATVDSDINGGMVRLKVTPSVTNSNIKITRLAVVV